MSRNNNSDPFLENGTYPITSNKINLTRLNFSKSDQIACLGTTRSVKSLMELVMPPQVPIDV